LAETVNFAFSCDRGRHIDI